MQLIQDGTDVAPELHFVIAATLKEIGDSWPYTNDEAQPERRAEPILNQIVSAFQAFCTPRGT